MPAARSPLVLPKESRTKSWMAVSMPETMCGSCASASDAATCSSSSPVLRWIRKRCSTRKTTVCLSTTSAKLLPLRYASRRHFRPRHEKLCLNAWLRPRSVPSSASAMDLRIAGPNERIQDADQRLGILADRASGRALHGRREHRGEPLVAAPRPGRRRGARTALTASANCCGSSSFCRSAASAARSCSSSTLRSASSRGSPSSRLGSTAATS